MTANSDFSCASEATQPVVRIRTEREAAEAMWAYYRDHKAELISSIKEFRESILHDLRQGIAVEAVFLPYMRPLVPVKVSGRPSSALARNQ